MAVLIIGTGIFLKVSSSKPKESIRAKIDLIAQQSIKNAIETGEFDTSEWEKALGIATSSDEYKVLAGISGTSTQEDEGPLTATDRFSRELLQKYVKYKESGGVIDNETTIRFVNELLLKDYGGPEGEKTYTESDITVLDSTLLSDMKRYGNYLGQALNHPVSAEYENEVVIINRVYETDDPQYLSQLTENLKRYQAIRAQIEEIAVPRPLKEAHIAVLNSLSTIIEGVRGMMLIETDPIGATKFMVNYEDGLKALDTSFAVIGSYFKNHYITFSSTESGYIFSK
jgi:hypothetical protein